MTITGNILPSKAVAEHKDISKYSDESCPKDIESRQL